MIWFRATARAALAVVAGGLVTTNNKQDGTWRGNLGSLPSPTMVTWLVDGNNLSCSRKVPNEREIILRELIKIASPRAESTSSSSSTSTNSVAPKQPDVISNIVVVFDGNEDEESDVTIVENDVWMEWTVTDGRNRLKDRADNWIVDTAIPRLRTVIDHRISENQGFTKVNLVSADKELQKRVSATRILNGGSFIHPPKFWNEYLPVLQAQQQKRTTRSQPKKHSQDSMEED